MTGQMIEISETQSDKGKKMSELCIRWEKNRKSVQRFYAAMSSEWNTVLEEGFLKLEKWINLIRLIYINNSQVSGVSSNLQGLKSSSLILFKQ